MPFSKASSEPATGATEPSFKRRAQSRGRYSRMRSVLSRLVS